MRAFAGTENDETLVVESFEVGSRGRIYISGDVREELGIEAPGGECDAFVAGGDNFGRWSEEDVEIGKGGEWTIPEPTRRFLGAEEQSTVRVALFSGNA